MLKLEIYKLRKEGKSYNEICKILKCAKSTVSYHCNNNNLSDDEIKIIRIKIENRKNKLKDWDITDEIYINIIELVKENKTYEDIERLLGIKPHIIKLVRNMENLTKYGKYGIPTNDMINEMQIDYNNGMTFRNIAKKHKTSYPTLYKYINQKEKKTDEEIKKQKSQSVVSWRQRTKLKLVDYMGGCCRKCGYRKSIKALEFHHLNPSEKDFTISGKSWSFERLKKEVDKCVLLCNRCHTEVHDGLIKINEDGSMVELVDTRA